MLAYSLRRIEDGPRWGRILRLHLRKCRHRYHPSDTRRPWYPPGIDDILGEGADNMCDLDIEGRLRGANMWGAGRHRDNAQQEGRNRHGDWVVDIPGPYLAGIAGRMVPMKAWPFDGRFG